MEVVCDAKPGTPLFFCVSADHYIADRNLVPRRDCLSYRPSRAHETPATRPDPGLSALAMGKKIKIQCGVCSTPVKLRHARRTCPNCHTEIAGSAEHKEAVTQEEKLVS